MIRVRGRNGWFDLAGTGAWVGSRFEKEPAPGYVEFMSKSPHTKQAPVQLEGPPLEIVRLLRRLARELQADHRATKARNSEQERKTKP